MKRTYLVVFILAIITLTTLCVLSLNKLGSAEGELQSVSYWFNLLMTLTGYFNFGFTTLLLVCGHFIIYKGKAPGFQKYLYIGLPYIMFIVFTIAAYQYIYDLYNVFQERTGQVIDTPDMNVFALNTSIFAFTIGAINLVVLKVLRK